MAPDAPRPDALFCWCRAGFEPELAAELTERAAGAQQPGYARTERNSGHVEFICEDAAALARALPFDDLIFARQKLLRLAELRGIDPRDRIAPILAALQGVPATPFGELWVEHPDSDAGKPLAGLARSFGNALRPALRKAGLLTREDDARRPRLHVIFLDGDHVVLGPGLARQRRVPARVPRRRVRAHRFRAADRPAGTVTPMSEATELLTETCPRCRREVEVRFYGPCEACRAELRASLGGDARVIELAEYEPKMNVTPNAVATKD